MHALVKGYLLCAYFPSKLQEGCIHIYVFIYFTVDPLKSRAVLLCFDVTASSLILMVPIIKYKQYVRYLLQHIYMYHSITIFTTVQNVQALATTWTAYHACLC